MGFTNHFRVCLKAEKERTKITAEGGPQEFQDHTDNMKRESYLNKMQNSTRTSQHLFHP